MVDLNMVWLAGLIGSAHGWSQADCSGRHSCGLPCWPQASGERRREYQQGVMIYVSTDAEDAFVNIDPLLDEPARLADAGVIVVENNPIDRRVRRLSLSEPGRDEPLLYSSAASPA